MAPKSSRKARASTSKPSNASKEPPHAMEQLNAVDSPAAKPRSVVAVTHSAVAEAQPNVIEPQNATIDAEARKPDSAAATISEGNVAPQTCGTVANGGRGEMERKEGNATEKVLATGAQENAQDPEAGASVEEAGNAAEGEEEEEEEFEYVIAEFGGPGFLTSSAANEDMALTNLHTSTPLLKMHGDLLLVGEYEETLGTSLLFCEGLEENAEGGVEGRRKIEFLGKTTKRIRFSAP